MQGQLACRACWLAGVAVLLDSLAGWATLLDVITGWLSRWLTGSLSGWFFGLCLAGFLDG